MFTPLCPVRLKHCAHLFCLIGTLLAATLLTSAATLEHKKSGMEEWPRCLGDIDCQSGSPVPAGAYCDVEERRCLCRLFHSPLNGSCRRVQCRSSADCAVGGHGQQYDAWWWFTCTREGKCQCQWPKELIREDTACSEPLWVKVLGGLLLASGLLFFAAFCAGCHFNGCTAAFFESRCRRPLKASAAAAGGPPGQQQKQHPVKPTEAKSPLKTSV
ncbi:hypothetical protein TYRP_004824 [Tyrophagus putrescentiae]|nr:hypothetical protein TYRP_004824 [Tyrophagus putrescentiae]